MNISEKENQEELSDQHNTNSTQSLQTKGLFNLIGNTEEEVEKLLGKPERIDLSAYGYDWWIYNENQDKYVQIGMENDQVVTVYALGEDVEISPLHIGQSIGEIYATNIVDTNISFKYNDNTYRFELSEEDINTNPLIKIGNVFVQLYIDKFTGTISSIRLMDTPTLIKLRPYELFFRGDLLEPPNENELDEAELELDDAKQIYELTNTFRSRYKVQPLKWDEKTAEAAYAHSIDMHESNNLSHTSQKFGELSDRLKAGKVDYQSTGENIAFNYMDAPAVVEGWMNNMEHRENLLNEQFTHIGVGVYQKYYTQNFIQILE